MHDSIEKLIHFYYQKNVIVEQKLEKGYIVTDYKERYMLFEMNEDNEHILLFESKYFPSLISTLYQTKHFRYNQQSFCLFEYIQPSQLAFINKYVMALQCLNEESLVTQKVNTVFYEKECELFEEKIKNTYERLEKIIDDFVNNQCLNVLFFPLIYEYDLILKMKQMALKYLNDYRQIVLKKDTCRFCIGINNVDISSFSMERNRFTDMNLIRFNKLTTNLIQLFKTDIEFEDLERLYLSKFDYEKHEKLSIIIELLCFDIIDLTLDGYKNIVWFSWLKDYISKINKIMKSLQIENDIMYN